ncbi:MAG: DNA replication/repair protein RecF [Alphaproteobacteria bacterium]
MSEAVLKRADSPEARAEGAARVAVTRLVLTDFRCYRRLKLEVDARPVVLFGPNGAGKTNLLEAVSFLAPGRGLRRAPLAEVRRRGAGRDASWAVAATVAGARGPVEIGTGDAVGDGQGPRRVVKIDGQRVRGPSALAEVVHAVWLTPDMDRLFEDRASARRRFMDRLVYGFDPRHAARVSAYERAMRERARLLRGGPADPAWLAALEHRMASEGVAIAASRREVLGRLKGACASAPGPFPAADVAVSGLVEDWLGETPALEAEARFRARLAAGRGEDAVTGGAAEGPHKSVFVVRHRDSGVPAEQCSTGEQKALVTAVVLATAEVQAEARGVAPLILLDEVAAHLDERRRHELFERLLGLGAQAWLAGTDRGVFAGLEAHAQFFRVADATVRPASGV